jgi:hypothetical protein
MTDPQRLLDGSGTELEQTLVKELQSYRGPRTMRPRTLAALGVTASAGLATSGALAWWSGKTWGTKLLTVSMTSILVGAPAAYFSLRRGSPPPTPPVLATVAARQPAQPLPPPAPPTALSVLDTPASSTPPPIARVSRRGVTPGADLRAELQSLDKVRSTMTSGDSLTALSLLDAYFQNFRTGRLRLEAEILRIDSLARVGQTEAARSYAKEFLRRHPKSVHAARLQSIAER